MQRGEKADRQAVPRGRESRPPATSPTFKLASCPTTDMSPPQLLTGPTLPGLEQAAIAPAPEHAGEHPESLLFLMDRSRSATATSARMRALGPPGMVRLETRAAFVTTCVERDSYERPTTHGNPPLRLPLPEP